jgi:hypothetical protein
MLTVHLPKVSAERAPVSSHGESPFERVFVENPSVAITPAPLVKFPFAKRLDQVKKVRLPGIISANNYVDRFDGLKTSPPSFKASVSLEVNRLYNH